jgi:putative copper resistance protein D
MGGDPSDRGRVEARPRVATRPAAGAWPGWPVLGAVAVTGALLTAAAVLVYGGGGPRPALPGLPDEGAVTPWVLPALRVLLDGSAVVTVGLLLTAVVLLRPTGTAEWYRRRAAVAAAAWGLSAVAAAAFTASDILGRPLGEIGDPGLLLRLAQSRSLLVEAALAGAVAAGAAWLRGRGGVPLLVLAVVAVLPPAFTGHAAGAGDHGTAVSSLLFHLAGVTVWLGGLVGLLTYATRRTGAPGALPPRTSATAQREVLSGAARRFSRLALVSWVVVGASGVVNAWVRLDSPADLVDTAYGRVVLGKTLALVALGVFGRLHRTQTLRALERGQRGAFVRLATAEVLVMAVTLGLAVGLSRTPI